MEKNGRVPDPVCCIHLRLNEDATSCKQLNGNECDEIRNFEGVVRKLTLPMKRHRILSFGEILWDVFSDGSECFGGAPANFACHAAILQANVAMIGAVGADPRGEAAVVRLQKLGVDTSLIQQRKEFPTGTVGVKLDSGKPSFTIHSNAAWDQLDWTSSLDEAVSNADAVYFGTLGQRNELSRGTIRRAIEAAAINGTLRLLDVNLRPPYSPASIVRESIETASIVKLSDEELIEVAAACDIPFNERPEPMLRSLLERYQLKMVVMTRGAAGAMLVSEEQTLEQPGIPTRVVDTIGAGDAFTAAFLCNLLRGKRLSEVLRLACETASRTCSHAGAVPATHAVVSS